ncbi:hypothetical protein J6590_082951, partial [Homalodisca vitripennis]
IPCSRETYYQLSRIFFQKLLLRRTRRTDGRTTSFTKDMSRPSQGVRHISVYYGRTVVLCTLSSKTAINTTQDRGDLYKSEVQHRYIVGVTVNNLEASSHCCSKL